MGRNKKYKDPSITDQQRASMRQILEEIKDQDSCPEKTAQAQRYLASLDVAQFKRLVDRARNQKANPHDEEGK